MKKIFLLLILSMLSNTLTFGQARVELQHNNLSEYPEITTGFRLYDDTGNEIRIDPSNPNAIAIDDIVIEEDAGSIVERDKLSIFCPEQTLTTFSAILVVDISTSMQDKIGSDKKIDVVKEVLEDFIKSFNPNRTEIAITLFAGDAIGHPQDINYTPFRPFTNDRDSLLESLDQIGTLYSGTNWNAAFLRKSSAPVKNLSALYYTRPSVRKYKPVIIFLTDGNHLPNWQQTGPVKVDEIRMEARANNATIYCIQFGNDDLTDDNLEALEELSVIGKPSNDNTDNLWLGINNAGQLKNVYSDILEEASTMGDPPPCYVTWLADCEGGSATFTFPNHGMVSDVTEYEVNDDKKPSLEINPRNFAFTDVTPGVPEPRTITITPKNNYAIIEDANFITGSRYMGRYTVSDWGTKGPPPITIDEDENYDIIIEYNPPDSLFSEAFIEFDGFACIDNDMNIEGFMNPFVEDLNLGNVQIGGSNTETFTQVFCNKTGETINISTVRVDGTDKDDFDVVSTNPPRPATLDSGQCMEVVISFNPTQEPPGSRTAQLIFATDFNGTDFEGTLTGMAIGGKTITSTNPGFDSASCVQPVVENTIMLENAGNLTITLDNCTITPDETNFTIKGGTFPATIAAGASEPITIVFDPSVWQNNNHTAQLRVESDAENSPYLIDLIGPMRNIDYTVVATHDFGEVCVNDPQTQTVNVTNNGNVPLNVDLTLPGPFNLPNGNTLNVAPGGTTEQVSIEFAPTADGAINQTLTVSDECSETAECAITAMGVDPSFTIDQTIDINSTIGDSGEITVTLTNQSASDLVITELNPQDAQITLKDYIPGAPTRTIAPGGTLTFTVVYTPADNNPISTTIEVVTTTCNFTDNIDVNGAPAQAVVDIEIDDKTGFDNMPISFEIYLRDGDKFDQSGTTEISTSVRYDATLLKNASGLPHVDDGGGFQIIEINNIPVVAQNTPQVIYTLDFDVMRDKPDGSYNSILEILNTTGNGGASFNADNGLFTLNPAAPKLFIDTISAAPGEELDIVIRMTDTANISEEINENILAQLQFNGLILEPLQSSYVQSKLFNPFFKNWIIQLELPAYTTGTDVLARIPVRAMLGNSTYANILLDSIRVKQGGASFPAKVDGLFTLNDICIDDDGTERLFDPSLSSGILSINPNPGSSMIQVEYETQEKGYTEVWVSDMMGNRVKELYNGVPAQGIDSKDFDGTELSNGVYFVIMQTPTQVFRKKIYIVR